MDISKIKVSGTLYDIKDATARGSLSTIDSIVQNLAAVATSGSYADLSDKPTIGSGVLTIQKNGTTVDTFNANATADKTINITLPAVGTLNTTATTAQSTSASEAFSSNITLHKIAKTGTFSDLIGKPTKLSDFTNDSGFITSQDLVTVMDYKGTKATVATLPSSGNKNGDVWHVTENNAEYAWNGSAWEELGTPVDLSGYATTASLATVATSGSYNDLSDKPSIPAAQIQADWNETDSTNIAYIQNAPLDVKKGDGLVYGIEIDNESVFIDGKSRFLVGSNGGNNNCICWDTAGDQGLTLRSDSEGMVLQSGAGVTLTTTGNNKFYYNNKEVATKNDIPTVNDAALTMQKNGTTVKTFTANASSGVNLNITMQYGGTTGTDAETLILNVA